MLGVGVTEVLFDVDPEAEIWLPVADLVICRSASLIDRFFIIVGGIDGLWWRVGLLKFDDNLKLTRWDAKDVYGGI